MNWTIFLQLIIGCVILFILVYFLLRYLGGDLTIKEQKVINEHNIYRKIPYSWNDREKIGIMYIYEITYESGRKKIKEIKTEL